MSDLISRQAAIDFIDAGRLCNPNEPRWSDNEMVNFLKSRPSAQQWIPVSKRLPEEGEQVLVCDDGGFIYTAEYETLSDGEEQWFESVEYRPMDDVVAWMPLPEPWRGVMEDDV